MKEAKPYIVVGVFYAAIFLFLIAGYSGSLGFDVITGNAVAENGKATSVGIQGLMILVLFFTNLVTLFFLIREKAKR